MALQKYSKKGLELVYRDDTYDHVIISQVLRDYKSLDIKKEDRVLDLGGYIGAFTLVAAKKAAHVTCVEPAPDNLEVLRENLKGVQNVNLIEAAVVNSDVPTLTFYLGTGTNRASHTILPIYKKAKQVVVKTVKIANLLDKYKPTVMKCDIEGSEYAFMETMKFPEYLKQIAIEWHTMNNDLVKKFDTSLKNLISQGFEVGYNRKFACKTVVQVLKRK